MDVGGGGGLLDGARTKEIRRKVVNVSIFIVIGIIDIVISAAFANTIVITYVPKSAKMVIASTISYLSRLCEIEKRRWCRSFQGLLIYKV